MECTLGCRVHTVQPLTWSVTSASNLQVRGCQVPGVAADEKLAAPVNLSHSLFRSAAHGRVFRSHWLAIAHGDAHPDRPPKGNNSSQPPSCRTDSCGFWGTPHTALVKARYAATCNAPGLRK